jgi:hypothetical protein
MGGSNRKLAGHRAVPTPPVADKYCVDCKWFCGKTYTIDHICFETCCSPKRLIETINPVWGKGKIPICNEPSKLRADNNLCGIKGKWFEEKEKPIPFCKDCAWFDDFYLGCLNKNRLREKTDVIWGRGQYALKDQAIDLRADESLCGKYGKWFTKKEIYEHKEYGASMSVKDTLLEMVKPPYDPTLDRKRKRLYEWRTRTREWANTIYFWLIPEVIFGLLLSVSLLFSKIAWVAPVLFGTVIVFVIMVICTFALSLIADHLEGKQID